MKRTKTISHSGDYGTVSVTINVDTKLLNRNETDLVITRMTDNAMEMLTRTPLVDASLSKIKVR